MPSSNWGPRRYDYYPRQVATQAGAWADAGVAPPVDRARRSDPRRWRPWPGAPVGVPAHPLRAQLGPPPIEAHVAACVEAFQRRGMHAGLACARRHGLQSGAELYVSLRAASEEQLAVKLAELRAAAVRSPSPSLTAQIAFVEARQAEVREAIGKGHTPAQAIADKPEVPRREVPRWIPIAGFGLAVLALLRSGGR